MESKDEWCNWVVLAMDLFIGVGFACLLGFDKVVGM